MLKRIRELFFTSFFTASFLVVGMGSASAALTDHTACDDPAVAGFGGYVDCGVYGGTFAGNDSVFDFKLDDTGWIGTDGTGWTVNGPTALDVVLGTDTSGTWSSPVPISQINLKAGDAYSVYFVGGATSGNWATAPTLLNSQVTNAQGLSHISFIEGGGFNVPEPGALSLLGLGLLGLGLTRRRIRS